MPGTGVPVPPCLSNSPRGVPYRYSTPPAPGSSGFITMGGISRCQLWAGSRVATGVPGTHVGSPGDLGLGRVSGGAGQGQPITFASGKPLAQAVPPSLAGSQGCWPRTVSPSCCCLPAAGRSRRWVSVAAAGTPLMGMVPPRRADTPIPASPHPAPSVGINPAMTDRRHGSRRGSRNRLFSSPWTSHKKDTSQTQNVGQQDLPEGPQHLRPR